MGDKRKVLFFTPPSCGGAERMTVFIAKMLPRNQFDVTIVIVGMDMGDIGKFIPSDYNIKLIRLKKIWHGGFFKIWNTIRIEKPDIVFSSLLYLNTHIILSAIFFKTKVIVRNNISFDEIKNRTKALIIRITYKFADKVIAQQEEMRDEIISYTGLSPEKVFTLHNPIDTALIDEKAKALSPFDKKDKSIKFVWTARVDRTKGQDILIKAFEIVHRAIPNSKLYLVGKYDQNDLFFQNLRQYINDNKLTKCVFFTGFDDNPYKWVINADCFVMPSRKEGLPNSLIDAMYLGKPVVATICIPVVSRIVKDGYNGILVVPEDIKAMASAMQKAFHLKDFKMTYIPASKDDFISIFRSI